MITLATLECVIYEKLIDSHAIVSVTIPITGKYKLETWNGWVERSLKAGDVVGGVKRLIRDTCPGYKEIKT